MSECNVAENTEAGCPISLKGTNQGFEILIDSSAPAERIASEIQSKLEEAPGFFKGGDVTLRFDDAPPRGYLGPIEAVTDRYELRIVGVHGPEEPVLHEALTDIAKDLGLVEPVLAAGSEGIVPELEVSEPPRVHSQVDPSEPSQEPVVPAPVEAAVQAVRGEGVLAPKLIAGPVRSGCILEFDGHLIVLGDVNPGAEISAVGSIIVLGRLRGIAHAGCTGNSAFILALQLQPQQLRIGSLVARAGDSDVAPEKAEIAYAKDGSIIVDYYKGRVPAGIATAKF